MQVLSLVLRFSIKMEIGVLVGADGKYNYMWFLKYDEVRGMIYCNYSIRITYFGYAENENKYIIIHIIILI